MTVREIGLGWRKIFDEGKVDKIIFEFKVKSNKFVLNLNLFLRNKFNKFLDPALKGHEDDKSTSRYERILREDISPIGNNWQE